MNHAIRSLAIAMLACTATATGQAYAHALWDPQGLIKPRSDRDDIKTGPCGEPRGNNPVTLAAGSTVNLSIERTIYHQGYFRIAFSPADDADFDDYVLADEIPENSGQRFYTVSVMLPDMECETCTLQLIQVMLDRSPPTNYYSCADIRLVRATPQDTQPPASVSQVLAVASDTAVQLNWINPGDEDLAGVLIIEGYSALNATPQPGLAYDPGASLGNGTAAFSGAATDHHLAGRLAGQTYHYSLFAYDQSLNYAPAVATSVTLADPLPNLAPRLQLLAEQDGKITQTISAGAGRVTVQAQISDTNSADQHQLTWNIVDGNLQDLDPAEEQFTFDPQGLQPGEYRISATTTDNGDPPLATSAEIILTLAQPAQPRGGHMGGLILWTLLLSLASPHLIRRRRE